MKVLRLGELGILDLVNIFHPILDLEQLVGHEPSDHPFLDLGAVVHPFLGPGVV